MKEDINSGEWFRNHEFKMHITYETEMIEHIGLKREIVKFIDLYKIANKSRQI